MNLTTFFNNWLKKNAEKCGQIRKSKLWILIRPFYAVIDKIFGINKFFKNTGFTVLHGHRTRLYELGFEKDALAELQRLIFDGFFKYESAWELALWHADHYSPYNAQKCLEYLAVASENAVSKQDMNQKAVIKAECLDILGQRNEAQNIINHALESAPDANLYLAMANLDQTLPNKIKWINKAFANCNLQKISAKYSSNLYFFDSITSEALNSPKSPQCLISVIVPAFNAEQTIGTALNSLLAQTWKNLEIIVVDDCSQDSTVEITQEYTKLDRRIMLIRSSFNQGPYISRNIALQQARGDLITCHDSDDWSHPQKIEIQASHLLNSPEVIANASQLTRADNNLQFFRRGNPGHYIQVNMSSLMLRRESVLEKAGYWDSVRFGADGEMVRRLRKIFGDKSVVYLKTGPLSFLRHTADSLTSNSFFGYPGYFMGARREYMESQANYLETSNSLYVDFPQKKRPFPVPCPLLSGNSEKERHYHIIIASDFRLPGGTTASNIEEIKAQKELGLRTGLVQIHRYDLDPTRRINPGIRSLVDGDLVEFVVYGQKASCDLLILRHPPVLQHIQKYLPDINPGNIRVIVNQTPVKHYGKNPRFYYSIPECAANLEKYFGKPGIWHPIGPLIREALLKHHHNDLKHISLGREDWHNIIDVSQWRRSRLFPDNKKIVIGRHSRDDIYKWPSDPDQLLDAYPDSEKFNVHILGGAEAPKKIIGRLPENWHVFEFGSKRPAEFLAGLDVFVYFTHPDLVESFGRVIFEAMASGVPVIIPPAYAKLFKEAAVYAETHQVKDRVLELVNNPESYQSQVNKALMMVKKNFSYQRHAARIGPFVHLKKPANES